MEQSLADAAEGKFNLYLDDPISQPVDSEPGSSSAGPESIWYAAANVGAEEWDWEADEGNCNADEANNRSAEPASSSTDRMPNSDPNRVPNEIIGCGVHRGPRQRQRNRHCPRK